jgi:hypothetical protein
VPPILTTAPALFGTAKIRPPVTVVENFSRAECFSALYYRRFSGLYPVLTAAPLLPEIARRSDRPGEYRNARIGKIRIRTERIRRDFFMPNLRHAARARRSM